MRLRLTLRGAEHRVVLPTNYNYLVQAPIYSNISWGLAEFRHDKGLIFGKRRFKMLTFSRLMGRCVFDGAHRLFVYEGDLTLYVSSPVQKFIGDLANTIIKKGFIVLGKNTLEVAEIAFPVKPYVKSG